MRDHRRDDGAERRARENHATLARFWLRAVLLLSVLGLAAMVARDLYRDPRVRELLRFAPAEPSHRRVHSIPADQSVPAPRARAEPPARRHAPVTKPGNEPQAEAPLGNTTPNEVAARVLLQVLAAKKLAPGVSLEVTDEAVVVSGELDSAETRSRILEIIEKGREARRIDARQLTVRQ